MDLPPADYWKRMYDDALDAWSAEIDLRRKAEAERDALAVKIAGMKASLLRMRRRAIMRGDSGPLEPEATP